MGDLETLMEMEKIKALKALFFFYVDHKKWDDLRSILTEDARMIISGIGEPVEGAQNVVDRVFRQTADLKTVHRGLNPAIIFESPTRATGVWAMEGVVSRADSQNPEAEKRTQGYGHYQDIFAKVDGAWRIQEFRHMPLFSRPLL